jgi:RIO kinase 1
MPRNIPRSRVDFDAHESFDEIHESFQQQPKREKFSPPPEEDLVVDRDGLIFNGTLQERQYVTESLGEFYDDHWFRQIVYKVKGGKEANVYCCRAEPEVRATIGGELIAAKVYRPRMFRAMHNDWFYKQGRVSRDPEGKAVYRGKDLNVARRDTRTGQKIDIASWCRWEYDTLLTLHAARITVPRPFAHGATAILMEYLGDESGAAPVLHSISLSREQAQTVYQRLLHDVEVSLLKCEMIHADLSAHNILWHQDRAVIIDWPQAVHARRHPDAKSLLHRDLERLCDYFARQGVRFDCEATEHAARLTDSLWRRLDREGGERL